MASLPAFVTAGAGSFLSGSRHGPSILSPRRPQQGLTCVAAPVSGGQSPNGPIPPSAPKPPTPRATPTPPVSRPSPPSARQPGSQSFSPGPRSFRPTPGGDGPGGDRPASAGRYSERGPGAGGGDRREYRGPREGRDARPAYGDRDSRGPRPPRRPYPPGALLYAECGKCTAAYEISPADLTEQGRKVVCAVCANSWFQRPDSLRALRDGSTFKDYPLEKKDELMASRPERRFPPGGPGGKEPYGERSGGGRFDREIPRRAYSDRGGPPRSDRAPPQRTYGGGGGGGRPRAGNSQHSLFIGNIPFSVVASDLEELLKGSGGLERVSLVTDPDGRSKGFAFADMKSEADVNNAVDTLNGYEVDGRQLTVRVGRKN